MKRAEHQPTTELLVYAGIFCKVWTVADRGTVLPQHAHRWGHISLLVAGKVHAWQGDDYLGVFTAPAMIKIPPDTPHRFETITNNVAIACLHNADHLDADGQPLVEREHAIDMED